MAEKNEFLQERLHSLDAYRGLIMISLAFGGFGLAATAELHLTALGQGREDVHGSADFWGVVNYQFSHVEWVGCAFWDLIQPSFMFMVGVAMAYSYVKRAEKGQSTPRLFLHALSRSVVLIFLGIFLVSNNQFSTNWTLVNVLTQIGLGYPFLFLLWRRPFAVQAIAAGVILVGTYLAFVCYPYAGIDISKGDTSVGVPQEWAKENLKGVGAAWHKNANIGHAVDVELLNLLPQVRPFAYNEGGYQTINFIPSLATMIFGLMCGELLRSRRTPSNKASLLFAAGVIGLALGMLLDQFGICPLVKRIWTPSWAIFSTGWCCLILASLYGVIDVVGWRRWSYPLMIVGVNSIAIYVMGMLMKRWTANTLMTHFGWDLFQHCGALYEPAVKATLVGLVFWVMCWWMYRQKIFIRI